MTAPAPTTDRRRVSAVVPAWNGHKITEADRRRARIRALVALSGILVREHREVEGEPTYRVHKDARGTWVTITAETRPETWRTTRERDLRPCRRCGRRNFSVHHGPEGWQCDDPAACAKREARALSCDRCGDRGTAWSIARTPHGNYCKDSCVQEVTATATSKA